MTSLHMCCASPIDIYFKMITSEDNGQQLLFNLGIYWVLAGVIAHET